MQGNEGKTKSENVKLEDQQYGEVNSGVRLPGFDSASETYNCDLGQAY